MRLRTAAAGAILAALLIAVPTISNAAQAADSAIHAMQYLQSQQLADGSLDDSAGETADFALGAAASGIDPNTLKATSGNSVYDWFAADLAAGTPKTLFDANSLGKVIQAVVAGGRDPQNFSGHNLLAALEGAGGTTGGDYNNGTGDFLDHFAGSNQSFVQSNAILGLVGANNATYPVPPAAVTRLRGLRSTSGATKGGWSSFGTFDSNDTAMALMALRAAGDTPGNQPAVFSDAFTYLHSQQDALSGGFTFSTDFGTASDPVSDALVIQALRAAGQDPSAGAWSNSNGNALSDLLTFQDPGSGGFAFEHGKKVQTFATSAMPAGLREAPFPITGGYVLGASIPAPITVVRSSPAPQALPSPLTLPHAGYGSPEPPRIFLAAAAVAGLIALTLITVTVAARAQR